MKTTDRHPAAFLAQVRRQAIAYRRQACHLRGDDRQQAIAAAAELEAWAAELATETPAPDATVPQRRRQTA